MLNGIFRAKIITLIISDYFLLSFDQHGGLLRKHRSGVN